MIPTSSFFLFSFCVFFVSTTNFPLFSTRKIPTTWLLFDPPSGIFWLLCWYNFMSSHGLRRPSRRGGTWRLCWYQIRAIIGGYKDELLLAQWVRKCTQWFFLKLYCKETHWRHLGTAREKKSSISVPQDQQVFFWCISFTEKWVNDVLNTSVMVYLQMGFRCIVWFSGAEDHSSGWLHHF